MEDTLRTPYERGNKNQTTTWEECIRFYKMLEVNYPKVLRFFEIGKSDTGMPIHAGVITADSVFDPVEIKRAFRPVFFNNNGIHPGEPEGVDVCMALVRDFCINAEFRKSLRNMAFLFIPIYNVDGCLNRNQSSRVNQDGPEKFGFRGTGLHLDLNRDFIKCDSLSTQAFNKFFATWDPDVMVDTHTSNGADYKYTMTVIQTQADKLGGYFTPFIRETLLPEIAELMEKRGWPICPYVNPVDETPDHGIEDFLETPRFSTGYAALSYTIGFMPETHMLKPYADRYESMRAFMLEMIEFSACYSLQIQTMRALTKEASHSNKSWPIKWKIDRSKVSKFKFKGYTAVYSPSILGNYTRLSYDRNKPWEKEIDYYDNFVPEIEVKAAKFYIIPQEWREVIQRLEWNNVKMDRASETTQAPVQTYHIKDVKTRPVPYEGRMFHDEVELEARSEIVIIKAGDYVVPMNQAKARYVVETLEPQAHDSFFRWGFFNSILEKKEAFSNYVFEDTAVELLEAEPDLRRQFETWKAENPQKLSDQESVLNFIFTHCKRFNEPEWRRYPIFRMI